MKKTLEKGAVNESKKPFKKEQQTNRDWRVRREMIFGNTVGHFEKERVWGRNQLSVGGGEHTAHTASC